MNDLGNPELGPIRRVVLIFCSDCIHDGSILMHAGKAEGAGLSIDSTSKWMVTRDSVVTDLKAARGLACIVGYGHTVTYDASRPANAWLAGRTLPLRGGGTLRPRRAQVNVIVRLAPTLE